MREASLVDIADGIAEIVGIIMSRPANQIGRDTTWQQLGLENGPLMVVLVRVELRFHVTITDEDAARAHNMEELAAVVLGLMGQDPCV